VTVAGHQQARAAKRAAQAAARERSMAADWWAGLDTQQRICALEERRNWWTRAQPIGGRDHIRLRDRFGRLGPMEQQAVIRSFRAAIVAPVGSWARRLGVPDTAPQEELEL
jgi:hypothetical protein